MAANTVSSLFPEGYGDFALESQDGVICHFPSQILGHMSPIFKEILKLGDNGPRGGTSPIKLTESIKTLELFLTHLDPKLPKASIDKETISDLLKAAHEYQVNTIMQWFDLEATTQRIRRGTVVTSDEFAIQYPGEALALAVRYELVETVRLSLRELCNGDSQMLLDHGPALGISIYMKVQQLRNTRIKNYLKWVGVMTKARPDSSKERTTASGPYFNWDRGPGNFICNKCVAQRAYWVTEILKAVHSNPVWASFIRAYETDSRCCFAWSDYFRDMLPEWEAEALQEESKLPEWP